MKVVLIHTVNLCHEIVMNKSQTSIQLSHSSEIGAIKSFSHQIHQTYSYAKTKVTPLCTWSALVSALITINL